VLEAERPLARLAAEREEVELAAEFELTVAADGFEVVLWNLCVGFLLLVGVG